MSICFLVLLFGSVLITPNNRAWWFSAMGVSALSLSVLLALA
ncbi:hypothetical protein [Variovorax sp. OAS795]